MSNKSRQKWSSSADTKSLEREVGHIQIDFDLTNDQVDPEAGTGGARASGENSQRTCRLETLENNVANTEEQLLNDIPNRCMSDVTAWQVGYRNINLSVNPIQKDTLGKRSDQQVDVNDIKFSMSNTL